MAKDYTQVNFRIPTALKEKIEQSALENECSITAEIVSRLEKSFEGSVFSKEQKIEYGRGFLAGAAAGLVFLYSGKLESLEEMYARDPSAELLLEIEKHKFLIDKLELLKEDDIKAIPGEIIKAL